MIFFNIYDDETSKQRDWLIKYLIMFYFTVPASGVGKLCRKNLEAYFMCLFVPTWY